MFPFPCLGALQLLPTTQVHYQPTRVGSRPPTACPERGLQCPWSQNQPLHQHPPKPLQSSLNLLSSKKPALRRTPLVKQLQLSVFSSQWLKCLKKKKKVFDLVATSTLLSDRLPTQQPASIDCRAASDASNDHKACDLRHGDASHCNNVSQLRPRRARRPPDPCSHHGNYWWTVRCYSKPRTSGERRWRAPRDQR